VKNQNTVYIAGKEVDGMKRPREPPTGGNKMNIGRILPTEEKERSPECKICLCDRIQSGCGNQMASSHCHGWGVRHGDG